MVGCTRRHGESSIEEGRYLGDEENSREICRPYIRWQGSRFQCRPTLNLLTLATILLACVSSATGQAKQPVNPAAPLPVAPLPEVKHQNSRQGACRVIPRSESAGKTMTATGASFLASIAGSAPLPLASQAASGRVRVEAAQELPPCPVSPFIDFFARFLNGPEVKPLTPKEKAWLAAKNLLDPFNAVTIGANASIAVAADSHSPYGPGIPGVARIVGISYSEDMTSEFFGTFAIPSIFHQDPHYHRDPHATIPRRVLHAIVQVGWTQGDHGKGMPNFANILGFPIDAEIANLYVPGEQTDLPATAARVVTGWGLAPTDNFITEFLPDVARRIHVRIVFIQQIINRVAQAEPGSAP